MEWLNNILKESIVEGKLDEVVEAVKKEMPKHMMPKDQFNKKSDELKETQNKMTELQTQIEELIKNTSVNEELKAELDKAKNDLVLFKEETEKRELTKDKQIALKDALVGAKADVNNIDLLMNDFNVEELTLNNKGEIVDFDDILSPIKEKRKALFLEEKIESEPPTTKTNTQTQTADLQLKRAFGLK